MKKQMLSGILLACACLLTGCTDIRTRLLPDLLAADADTVYHFAAHTSQENAVITADADAPLRMPDALQAASGAEISTGHLTMLIAGRNPCGIAEAYLQAQIIAPTCTLLAVPENACGLLKAGKLPTPDQIQAAADTGMLPCRTADAVIGDLWGGSGVTAVYYAEQGELSLALFSAEEFCGRLSADACRGLALLGKRRKSFVFTASDGTVFRIRHAVLSLRAEDSGAGIGFAVSGNASAEPPLNAAGAARLREMLTAALTETACEHGADLIFLRECAIRDGIAEAASCSQAEWRELLKQSTCRVDFSPECE